MKTLLIIFLASALFFLFSFHTSAQNIRWNTAPQKGFVFQINNKEAQKLLTRSPADTIFHGLLHTLVDTFDVSKGWINRPAKGHFILAKIIGNKLHCEYTSVFPYQVFLLKEYDALSLQVLDLEGNVREDAKVKFKLRRLRIDRESKTYRLENNWFTGDHKIVTAELDGFRSVFNVEKHEAPFWYNDYYNHDDGPSFYSYMITDKNKYKPNEKVRFKSYALSHSRSPLHKELEIRLRNGNKSIRAGKIIPHRPGSYAGEFQLHDSLKLTLDRNYTIELMEKGGRIVASCNFKYEDYEVHGNNLEVHLATAKQFHPAKNELSITATDVNGLVLKDARARVLVKTQTIRETFQPLVILPDTLMYTEVALGSNGATVVNIPSELFQKTNTAYEVQVSVLNSENHRMERKAAAVHYYSQYELTTRFSSDSIIYELLNNGVPMRAIPFQMQYNGETTMRQVLLPYKEKLNAAISTVRFKGDLLAKEIILRNLIPEIRPEGGIQKDSFNIQLYNPQKLEVSWYIYQGSVLLQKGFGSEMDYRSLITDRTQTYYVELLYSFGGQENLKRKEYEFKEGFLNVSLDVPGRVYPGQQVDATIQVTDQSGQPVNGVDLTALAVTGKLNYTLPDLPYYGSGSAPRSQSAHYSKSDVNKRTAVLDLDYKQWEKRAGLDTMKYYQFTYPGAKLFKHTVASDDSTQFSVYVMQKGTAKQVYVIEVDRKPVYYSWADQPDAYSFYVSPKKKKAITLRLYDRVLLLDSMKFEAGKKTILSIDLDHLPGIVSVYPTYTPTVRKRDTRNNYPRFTSTEVSRHLNYLSSFRKAEGNTYLERRKEFTPLFSAQSYIPKADIIVGPVTPAMQTYVNTRYAVTTAYQHSGNYAYAFEDNIVYKMNVSGLIPDRLEDRAFSPMKTINDKVMTKKEFLSYHIPESKWHTRAIDLVDYASRVNILLPEEKAASGIAAFLFQNSVNGQMVSPCQDHYKSKSDFYSIPRGLHHAIVLYNNGTYLKMDSIALKSRTSVVMDLNKSPWHAADSLSARWLSTASNDCYRSVTAPSKSYSIHYPEAVVGNVRGVIYDDTNMPVPGTNIVVKGTTNGTVTDVDGRFALDIHENTAVLVISFIGYKTKEIEVQVGADLTVYMEMDIQQLSEVVVVGYGTERKMEMTGSVSLRGMVSGVMIGRPDVIAVDVPETKSEEGMKREAEQQLYQELLTLSTIRSNFSDVGFWEPKLFTDKQGKSQFKITFPDDITRWDATVYAMNRRLQTGTARKSIKAYKPLMAELHVPQFLTRGDSALFLGKVLNYTQDQNITGKVTWSGAQTDFEKSVRFTEFHTDLLPVHPVSTDSVTTRYSFVRDDGYVDGEERTVSVVEQGVIRADGTLSILKNKEEVLVKAGEKENVIIELLDNPLDIYAGEVRYLVNYKYDCNEQLASKLFGLVNYRQLMQFEGKPFKNDKDVNKIIARLLKNQNQEFLWSWWDVSSGTSYWMSAHILRALKAAQEAGYKVDLDITNIARKAEYKFDMLHQYAIYDADLLNALALWGAKLNYGKHITRLDSMVLKTQKMYNSKAWRRYNYSYSLLKEKLLLLEARQLLHLPYQRDSVLRYKKEGIMGDLHFSDDQPHSYWYNNELTTNTIAYRIVKRDSVLKAMTVPMQMYFLSMRKQGGWNTYHSSNVLMSVLPDLLAEGVSKKQVASVQFSGKVNATITKFPYRLELQPQEEVHIRKESGLPLYYMQYTKERVTKAKTGVEGFAIKTTLGNTNRTLEAGKPVTLTVEVDVTKDASVEYVMIEVPIPGACSYADKSQSYNPVETHREYFKERTVIFCENMKPGRYTFAVQLLPRFTGSYLINPAQVSLMYVPVVNANTEMKTVRVK